MAVHVLLWPMIATGLISYRDRAYISSCKVDVCNAIAERLSETGADFFVPAELSTEGTYILAEELGQRGNKLDIVVNDADTA